MTPDEIGKATTPNALRDASADRLDDLANHATSLLLSADAGVARQMQNCAAGDSCRAGSSALAEAEIDRMGDSDSDDHWRCCCTSRAVLDNSVNVADWI
jgi:hypothetical protein